MSNKRSFGKAAEELCAHLGYKFAVAATGLVARIADYVQEVETAQKSFNAALDRAADRVGVMNVERLMAGRDMVEQTNAWPAPRTRSGAEIAAEAHRSHRAQKQYWPGSARYEQMMFNRRAEAYVAKHGIAAFEEEMRKADRTAAPQLPALPR